jgi:hypothetical protein
MSDAAAYAGLRQRLGESRERLLRVISGVTEQQFKQRPPATADDPRPWCIAEVLAHLLLTEEAWTRCIEAALAEDGAEVLAPSAASLDDQARARRMAPVPQLIHGLLAARRELERQIGRAAEATAERSVRHSELGVLTVKAIAGRCADDELAHAARIEALRLTVGAKSMDNAGPA